MPHLHRTNVHFRGLLVIALALAAWQVLGGTGAHAQGFEVAGSDARDYQASSSTPFIGSATVPRPGQCDGRLDYGTGDDGCGSMTGGPSGGIAGRS